MSSLSLNESLQKNAFSTRLYPLKYKIYCLYACTLINSLLACLYYAVDNALNVGLNLFQETK